MTDVLAHELRSYTEWFEDEAVTEIDINGEILFIQRQGQPYMEKISVVVDTDHTYHLATLIAGRTGKHINAKTPWAASTLADGTRAHAVIPPAADKIYLSLRKHNKRVISLERYLQEGAFDETREQSQIANNLSRQRPPLECPADYPGYLRDAIESHETIIVSGPTDAGKTTVMRGLANEINPRERIVCVQDVDELHGLPHENIVKLMVNEAWATYNQQIENCLRMNPDRLLVQEIRGSEAHAFLTATQTGHCGMTTVHAGSSLEAFDRIAGMVMQAPGARQLTKQQILETLTTGIGLVIQTGKRNNQRVITEVYAR